MDCIFCKIIHREIDSKLIYEDEHVLAFNDNNPQAPQHKLIIPREHIATLNDLPAEKLYLTGHLIGTAQKLAKTLNIADDGYRLVMNCNHAAGQSVSHIHLHLLGGRNMAWPPG